MTVLHPQDSLRLLPEMSLWQQLIEASPGAPVGGAGGGANYYRQFAMLVLKHEDDHTDILPFELSIGHPTPANQNLESLLGRDILEYYRLNFEAGSTSRPAQR